MTGITAKLWMSFIKKSEQKSKTEKKIQEIFHTQEQ